MIVREGWTPVDMRFENTDKECTSCGIIIHTGDLETRLSRPNILLVEQMDIPGHPFGIPAGKVEKFDKEPQDTAQREIEEETGAHIKQNRLNELLTITTDGKIKIIYEANVSMSEIPTVNGWEYSQGLWRAERNQFEIGRMLFIRPTDLFEKEIRDEKGVNLYRPDIFVHIRRVMESLKLVLAY